MGIDDGNYNEKLSETLSELERLLKSKHADYGSENLLKFGMFGIIVRMFDKMARLENLQSKKATVNETIKDTLLDLAGYAIQAIVLFGNDSKERE